MAVHLNEWQDGSRNNLREPYYKGWDIWRYAHGQGTAGISKMIAAVYKPGTMLYLNYSLYAGGEVDIPRTQKQMGRELKKLFEVPKCICIVEAQKVVKSKSRYVSVQFYARMKSRPEDEKMLQVPQAAENGIVLWEPEEED